jgi:phage terminase large subunit GpA-like protein
MYADARTEVYGALARAFAPRQHLTVSEWADRNITLSTKESPEAGPWRTDRNPLLKEPMDCMSARSTVRVLVLKWPIQFGKTQIMAIGQSYRMCQKPGPMLVITATEHLRQDLVDQKFAPLYENPAIKAVLKTTNSRDSANRRFFKDYLGGLVFFEHAAGVAHLKMKSIRDIYADEVSSIVKGLKGGENAFSELRGRISAYEGKSFQCFVSSPDIEGYCNITKLYDEGDQRHYYVPCPECEKKQHLEWEHFYFDQHNHAWYVCEHCASVIEEKHKADMIRQGGWVAEKPEKTAQGYRSYTANALYHPFGLGLRWQSLAAEWKAAQNDRSELKTFFNNRLALAWYLPELRKAQLHTLADRAEPYALRVAPKGVKGLVVSVDTQDNRLEYQLTGWADGSEMWVIDYGTFEGDPFEDKVWVQLTDYCNAPVGREGGDHLPISACIVDAGGHKTHAVYNWARQRFVSRPMAIFGAKDKRAVALSRPKAQDVRWRGQIDKQGVHTRQVGTVYCKHWLMGAITASVECQPHERRIHFSEQLQPDYFNGLITEFYRPETGRFEKKKGDDKEGNTARNEPLDLCVYAYAAIHHEDLMWFKTGMERWPIPLELGKKPERKQIWIPD